jgi:hypothetical protein
LLTKQKKKKNYLGIVKINQKKKTIDTYKNIDTHEQKHTGRKKEKEEPSQAHLGAPATSQRKEQVLRQCDQSLLLQ